MKNLLFFTPFIIIGAVLLQILKQLGIFKTVKVIDKDFRNCKYVNLFTPGPEDITKYNESTLIVSSGDLSKISIIGDPLLASPGKIFAIYDADQSQFNMKEIEIQSFPHYIGFIPHGLYIKQFPDGKYLYVINHAYQRGGERVECFKIEESPNALSLHYQFSLNFSDKFMGTTNDLVILNQTHLLITVPQVYPHPVNGLKDRDFFTNLKALIIPTFQYKKTFIYCCTFNPIQNEQIRPDCKRLEQTASIFANGITRDNDNHIWLADTVGQVVKKYKYEPQNPKVLTLIEEIETDGGIDNLEYDNETNKIYAATIFRLFEHIQYQGEIKAANEYQQYQIQKTMYMQVDEIELNPKSENYNKVHTILRTKNGEQGNSASYQIGNNLFIGSFAEKQLMVCSRKKKITDESEQ